MWPINKAAEYEEQMRAAGWLVLLLNHLLHNSHRQHTFRYRVRVQGCCFTQSLEDVLHCTLKGLRRHCKTAQED